MSDTGQSLWKATAKTPARNPLEKNTQADVCIVGAGIAGLSTAFQLVKEGRSVVVLDDGPIGSGQTQMTTAHLASEIDDRMVEIERLHGYEGARLAAESHAAAIDHIESVVAAEAIDCDFTRLDGYLFNPPGKNGDLLERELAAAARTGVLDVTRLPRAPLAYDTGPCLRFRHQGQFHPLKYLAGMAAAIEKLGGKIYNSTHARQVTGGKEAAVTTTEGHKVSAGAIVVATNSPINDMYVIHTKQAPYMSYVLTARVPAGSVEPGLYWDTADPYHYVRLQRGDTALHDYLIIGGEDHKSGQAQNATARFGQLESWARERFLIDAIDFRWAGQVMETVDGLAYIGRNPDDKDNVYIATGDSGMGMTHGTIAGILLGDLIAGRDNRWAKLYDPARKTLSALGEFLKENANVAAQYTSWLTAGEVKSAAEVLPGQGALMRRGLKKVALYRDQDGNLTELTAVCPHLGCFVAFNSAQQTWDCPCHGSRFDARGKVTNGPANIDLEKVEPG